MSDLVLNLKQKQERTGKEERKRGRGHSKGEVKWSYMIKRLGRNITGEEAERKRGFLRRGWAENVREYRVSEIGQGEGRVKLLSSYLLAVEAHGGGCS